MGQHLVTHDPCDPSDFRDPFDPCPMTHRPIPCSDVASKSRLKLAARAVLSADAGLLVLSKYKG